MGIPSNKDLEEMLDWYSSRLLAHHDKGERAETDIPKLIHYIRQLKNQIEDLSSDFRAEREYMEYLTDK